MDRALLTAAGEQAVIDDILNSNLFPMMGLGKLAAAILGAGTFVNFSGYPGVTPTTPATLSVLVNDCEMYTLEAVDSAMYGDIPANSYQITKQCIAINNSPIALLVPVTAGNSIAYLIQIAFSETDTNVVNRNFNTVTNPLPVATVRKCALTINAKAGASVTTGSQVPPSPDAGFVGIYVVTVANDQTQITSGNISPYTGAPFITERLADKISQTTADGRYAQKSAIQSGLLTYSADTGAANAYIATLSPALTTYGAGTRFSLKIANDNTGASTVNVNTLGNKNITYTNGDALTGGELVAGMIAEFEGDGTNIQLLNPANFANCAFSATVSASQSLPPSPSTPIQFNALDPGSSTCFNTSTYTFTAPAPGLYNFSSGVALDSVPNGVGMNLQLYKNGVLFRQAGKTNGGSTTLLDAQINVPVFLAQNDTIVVKANHSNGANLSTDTSSTYMWFAGYRVS